MRILKTVTACIGILALPFCVGCGVIAIPQISPSISRVLPQTVPAGTDGVTMKVVGKNFTNQAVILWNGTTLPTSVVDSGTLAARVQRGSLAAPTTAQLTVQDQRSGEVSNTVPVTVTPPGPSGSTAPSAPALSVTAPSIPAATVGVSLSLSFSASGGTSPYTWSIDGQLPAGLTLNSSTGVISGAPTASGTSSFGVVVKDAGSTPQQAEAAATLTVNAAPRSARGSQLVINSGALRGGTARESYSATLSATGGTAPYTWSVASGSLPAGLSLSASGVISGSPTQNGTSSFTVGVKDSGSPAQTATGSFAITIGGSTPGSSSPLAITTSTLPSGSQGTSYSTTLQASGGTPAYTWSISSGNLPEGLKLNATSGSISGTPTASGTSNFTVTMSDNSNPVQTKSATFSIAVSSVAPVSGPGTTWYVRKDGGTRYSAIQTSGQCDGKGDAAYPGSGTNQHCAFNDVRWLWQDGSSNLSLSFPSWGWIISGGDTVIIRGSLASGTSWRVGWNNSSGALDPNGLIYGLQGDPYSSGAPPVPSGTATQHTRILGENYAACTAQSARTQLHGGWSVFNVFNLTGSSYVELGCLDITDFSNCGKDMDAVTCPDGSQDFARFGIRFSNTSTHDTLTDVRVHGMAADGIVGPTGDGFVGTDLSIVGNADAGWNADAGDGTTGVGSFFVQNYEISWNGCVEEYPIVDKLPYFSCRDQSTGGYGDGFGTASLDSPAPGWQIRFDQGVVSYNTQDGLDALHVGGTGSAMTVTRTLAYGNEGQAFKAGGGAIATIQNNVVVGNCEAIPTTTIPGRPSTTQDSLGNWCRAGNTAVVIETVPGHPASFQNNTLFSENSIGLEVEYGTSDTGPTNTLLYNNNVFVGFYNAPNTANPTPIYSNTNMKMLTNPGASWTHNSYFGQRSNWACPQPGESAAICTDPGLADETYHAFGFGNMKPSSGSSAIKGAGVGLPGITLDYTGQTRGNPPSIGAYE